MIRSRLPVFALAAICAIAGCDGGDPAANSANDTAALPTPADNAMLSVEPAPASNAVAVNSANPAMTGKIPAALHGRWGMVPGDCTSTRGDAKGLLTVTAGELRFYESRAVPTSEVEARAESVDGTFNFTGEGQTWSKEMSLQLQQQKLVRTEANPTVSYTYARCS